MVFLNGAQMSAKITFQKKKKKKKAKYNQAPSHDRNERVKQASHLF